MAWGLAWLALALSGCVIEADYTGTHFRCDDGTTCPEGFQCVSGFCESNPDLSVPVDAAADLTPVLPPACGKTADYVDNFDGTAPASFWNVTGASQVGGQLTVSLPSQANAMVEGFYRSIQRTDLTGSRLSIEVIQATSTSSQAEAFLRLRFDATNVIEVAQRNNGLYLQQQKVATYDNAAQRWWQLREAAGTIDLYASSDGSSWGTPLGSTPTPPFAASVFIEIGASTPMGEPSPGIAQFDQLNGGGQPMAPSCDM
jgi:hypothetical protein